jgi:hypothetical protein
MNTTLHKIDPSERRAALRLLAYGLWIRLAIIAAMAPVGALVALFEGGSGFAVPLAVAVIGCAAAPWAWRRALASIADAESHAPPVRAAAALLRAGAPAPAGVQG